MPEPGVCEEQHGAAAVGLLRICCRGWWQNLLLHRGMRPRLDLSWAVLRSQYRILLLSQCCHGSVCASPTLLEPCYRGENQCSQRRDVLYPPMACPLGFEECSWPGEAMVDAEG